MHDADLGGGQAHADRVVHQVAHPLDLLPELVVEPVDRARPGAQHRVAELADLGERRGPPGRGLGIELGPFRPGLVAGLGLGLDAGLGL